VAFCATTTFAVPLSKLLMYGIRFPVLVRVLLDQYPVHESPPADASAMNVGAVVLLKDVNSWRPSPEELV